MIHTIENSRLRVSVNTLGAQLWSIQTPDGAEYLWQGDPAYWGDRAINLFPYVARLWQGVYTLYGQTYKMPIHGFAPESEFTLEKKTDTSLTFALASNEKTLAMYPRRFVYRIVCALEGNRLSVTFEAENHDSSTMHFGLGGHPGFNVPLEAGLRFEDYRLRFDPACTPVRVGFTPECFVGGKDEPFALEGGCVLNLSHDLFDNDAIVLRDMARAVTLESPKGKRSVTVSYPDMPFLGVWHMPKTDAPYVCIEPWRSLPSQHGEVTALEEKEDLVRLGPGEIYRNTWTIEINE